MKRFYIMKLNKFTVVLAILLVSILAIGAVSAESVDDAGIVAVADGDIQESVEVTDTADDLSTADTADETVGDDSSAGPDDTVDYDLDDNTYSTYFNEDGTATEALSSEGNYYLNVGNLTNKDIKIVSGQNIYIQGKDGAGFIKNGTITIGDGTPDAINTVQISGLTFINTNKDGIVINDYSNNVAIAQNKFDLTFDDSITNAMAIVSYGFVNNTIITGNTITMNSAATYTYGLDFMYYLPGWKEHASSNAANFFVANNDISITATGESGMAEAMYLDTIIDSVIEGNNIYVKTTTPGLVNYAMQVSDSWGFYADPYGDSSYNVTIKDNNILLDSVDLAYGITAISLWPYNEDYETLIKDIVISGNDLTINSQSGAVGIGVQSSDVEITDNKVTINAGNKAAESNPDPVFGSDSYAIYIKNFDDLYDMGNFVNNTVTGNTIVTNVQAIKASKEDDDVQPLSIENNIIDYNIDDDSYSNFFNDDGTAKDVLNPLGDYSLIIGTLNNKDIIIGSGSNINITANDYEGIINGGTITIGDGAGSAGSIIISGLRITNTNKEGIVINDLTTNVTISQNNLDLSFDDSVGNAMAIVSYGFVDGMTIVNNVINMDSAATYTYGLDFMYYLPGWKEHASSNAANFFVANNDISITATGESGMAEAMYLDSIIDSVIEGNNIFVKTTTPGLVNYAMQVSDSWGFYADPYGDSPYNVAIKDNNIVLDSADLAYGITEISLWPYNEDFETLIKDMVITGNDVTITSQSGAVGIGVQSSDVEITDNKVTINAGNKAFESNPDPVFGSDSYAIYIKNYDNLYDMGYFKNNTVTGNTIVSNVEAIKAYEEGDQVQPLTIEDNEVFTSYLIDDDTYATYFNADGTIKDDAPIAAGDVLLLGDLTGKKLVIDTPLTIRGVPYNSLVNTTINLVQGADNSVIEDLNMEFTGDDTTGSIGIIYIKEVSNVTIQNNYIVVPNFVDKTGSKYGSSVYAIEVESGALGCSHITINNNYVLIEGTCRYLYGIDVFKTYGSENRNKDIAIFENYVELNGGSRMAEGIYVSESDDVVIDGNNISSTSNGAAYGVATDQLTDAVIASNNIKVDAATQAYGITATTSGTDTIIRGNEIDAKGTGAVGIGINKQDGVIIEDNKVAIDGGDYTTITSSDSLGTANAAILVGEGNTNVEMSGNDVTETSAVRLDTAIEVSDMTVTAAPSGEGKLEITLKTVSGMLLANQTVKVVFDNAVYELTTDAKGVAVLPFALNKGGSYNVDVFYLGDDNYRGSDATAKLTINKIKTAITASGKTFLATATTKKLTATLKDANGNVLANKKVTFTVNGKTYTATTNAKGVATVKLALKAAKTYTVSIKFAGDSVYAASTKSVKVKLNKEKTKITAPKKTFKRTAKTKKVVITLKNSKGKAIAKKKVTLIVNKKKYTVKTNKKGKATFKVKLTKKGTFKYTAKFAGDTQYKAVKKTGKIKIK